MVTVGQLLVQLKFINIRLIPGFFVTKPLLCPILSNRSAKIEFSTKGFGGKVKNNQPHPRAAFWLKTVLYFIVLMILLYMYGYFGIGQAPFIYNEF